MDRRRVFGYLLASLLIGAPRLARTQGLTVVRLIGALNDGVLDPEYERGETQALKGLGWVEAKNLRVERRYSYEQPEALNPLAEELVRARVELIVTNGTAATLAAKRATATIPIVFSSAGDPVAYGLVTSLSRPGGNVTGFSTTASELTAKSLSVLKDVLPNLRRLGVLIPSTNPFHRGTRPRVQQACRRLGIEPFFEEYATTGEIVDAIARLARQRVQAVKLMDTIEEENQFQIVNAAREHSLPMMSSGARLVQAGALVCYSVTDAEIFDRRANFIDRILRGAKPNDLPVEQPTRFKLVINLKTARGLKLAIPQSILQRADEVIQ